MSPFNLVDLPDDIFLHVAPHLDVKDVLALRETCTRLCRATQLKHLWHQMLCAGTGLSPQLASVPYSRPFTELTSFQLEALATHAVALQRHIRKGMQPRLSVNLDGARPITWVHVLQRRWLLVAASDSSISELSLSSLQSLLPPERGRPRPPAVATAYLSGPVAIGFVQVQEERVIIALEIRSPDSATEILSISTKDGSPAFVRLTSLPGVSRLRCLEGPLLGFALWNEVSIPCLIDWRTKEVVKLREVPNTTGGCVSMAFRGDLISMVTTTRVKIYQRTGQEPSGNGHHLRPLCSLVLPDPIFDAALAFIDPPYETAVDVSDDRRPLCVLRLLHASTNDSGLTVYDIEVPSQGEALLRPVWSHPCVNHDDKTRPAFGKQPQTLSWLTGQPGATWSHVRFNTTAIPIAHLQSSLCDASPVSIYEVSDPTMPGMYCMGVRDYDEDVGILVVGNACGELCVMDLTGLYSSRLQSCFADTPFPAATEFDKLMPTHPVPAIAAPPYPYSKFGAGYDSAPDPATRDTWLARWKREQPDDVPKRWTTDFYDPEDDRIPWWFFIPTVGANLAWELERSAHFYGSVMPLLYHDGGASATIFKCGGLLFLFEEETESLYVLDPESSASDVARAFDEDRLEDHLVYAVWSNGTPVSLESSRYFVLWEWEKYRGRNRWRELMERGGEVCDDWLEDGRTVDLFVVDPVAGLLEQEKKNENLAKMKAARAAARAAAK